MKSPLGLCLWMGLALRLLLRQVHPGAVVGGAAKPLPDACVKTRVREHVRAAAGGARSRRRTDVQLSRRLQTGARTFSAAHSVFPRPCPQAHLFRRLPIHAATRLWSAYPFDSFSASTLLLVCLSRVGNRRQPRCPDRAPQFACAAVFPRNPPQLDHCFHSGAFTLRVATRARPKH